MRAIKKIINLMTHSTLPKDRVQYFDKNNFFLKVIWIKYKYIGMIIFKVTEIQEVHHKVNKFRKIRRD